MRAFALIHIVAYEFIRKVSTTYEGYPGWFVGLFGGGWPAGLWSWRWH
ncbi:MAG TPA: hypothetical protein VLT34_09245 [Arthrobacter sp.]|nr:hypothetical protein [Arthrobacter sp.]